MPSDEEKETKAIMKRIKIGNELTNKRKQKKATLSDIGMKLGVSANYISEIERGLKIPSDKMIQQLAEFYEYDEGDLFKRFGKIPLFTRKTLEENPCLSEIIDEIGKNKSLSNQKKKEVMKELLRFTKSLLRSAEERGEDG